MLKYVLAGCCLLCMLGVRPWKLLAGYTVTLLLLFDGIVQGFYGFANNPQLGIQYLALFPAADSFSIFGNTDTLSSSKVYKAAILLCTLTLCLPYMLIGTHRLLYGGMELFTDDAILHSLTVRDLQHAEHNIDSGLFVLNYPFVFPKAKFGFFITTFFELLTPIILLNNTFRRIWLGVIVPFHVFTLISMNIFFWENLVLIILLLTRCPYWIERLQLSKDSLIPFAK